MNDSTRDRSVLDEAFEAARSVELERQLLGSILVDPEACLAYGLDEVHVDLFTRQDHRRIWREIEETRRRGEAIEFRGIGERLLGQVDPLEFVCIVESVPSGAAFPARLRASVDLHCRRLLVDGALKLLQQAGDRAVRTEDLERDSAAVLSRVRGQLARRAPERVGEVFRRVIADLEARGGGSDTGPLPAGVADVDAILDGGFRPGTLAILAARPSIGKTSLALHVARSVALRGMATLFVTLEMSADELAAKYLAIASDLTIHALRGGAPLASADFAELRAAAASEAEVPLLLAEPHRSSMGCILATIREAVTRRGVRFVALDYLQLVEADGRYANRYEQVTAITRDLKQLARELEIPLLVLAQLNRAAEARSDHRPQLGDLRDSGSIEQDADVVLLLHWPWKHDSGKARDHVDLIVAKNRLGATGTIGLRFDAAHGRYAGRGEFDL